MEKCKIKSLKSSMTLTFFRTIALICFFSGLSICLAGQVQQEIMRNRYGTIQNPCISVNEDTGEVQIEVDKNVIEWHELSTLQNIAFYACYAAMILLPIIFILVGIGTATKSFYRKKLNIPIQQLQNGINRIQNNDLDFSLSYDGKDELGQLCRSMEKMRCELLRDKKELWRTLEERKLLNASIAHDLRTPLTILNGYLDFLEINIPQDKVTEDSLMDTLSCMKGAVARLSDYIACVHDVEKLENIEIHREPVETKSLLNEIEHNIAILEKEKQITFSGVVSSPLLSLDKSILFRIIDNLLLNALRFAETKIEVELVQKENELTVTVKDDGIGFTDLERTRATTLFYSTDKGNDHFGIGLGICKILCQKQGGTLRLTNQQGKSACVAAKILIE